MPESRQQITLSFAPLVHQAAPAVVNVYTRKVVREQNPLAPLFADPFFQRFFGDAMPPGMNRERVQNSLGSGVIVRPDGLIVTNDHVVKGSDAITVVLADRREFEATVVSTDSRTDLALLRIDAGGQRLPYLELRDSDEVEVGDLVLAIGNPFGVGQTVTSGIVSAVARTASGITDYNFFIQTDAAINPGNSGGALVGMDGRLVGINTAIYSRSGGSLGIGFAIPANMVRTVVEAVASGGRVVRPWLGVSGQSVTADMAHALGLPRPAGVLINGIEEASPAGQAGLKTGDVVTAVNGREVDDPEAMRFRIATLPVGGQAALSVMRGGQTRELSFGLIAPPETPARDTTELKGRHPMGGATVANLSPALAEEIRFEGTARGVVVLAVERGSAAGQVGLE
ncbi:MAG TPA: Do family serine endopeptidase, partial [Azospirillaceae bacterium]|nr:Do family serine endopeptidase [Azospirillaceae bacterium]